MAINNFELIKSLLSFEFEDDSIYYHLQILRRGKDHPELPSANRCIKAYFICSEGNLDSLEKEIKELCELFKARAYINLSPKSIKKTAALQMKYLAQRMYEGDYKKIWRAWNICAGEIKSEEPRWIVDLDNYDKNTITKIGIEDFIDSLKPRNIVNGIGKSFDITPSKIISQIPTKSGFHLITTPFDIMEFKKEYPNIDIHKNNPTVLYIPECIE